MPTAQVRSLETVYLNFVLAALASDGRCRNRMGSDRRWSDLHSTGDWWGRAVWGLGVAASTSTSPVTRARALAGFLIAAQQRSPHNRAMAFAALGAGALLKHRRDVHVAWLLLADCGTALGTPGVSAQWPWPEPRLRYANGSVCDALIVAGHTLRDADLERRGVRLLDWLLTRQTRDAHLSVTPAAGRGQELTAPEFDQQPIEVAALAEACASAYWATADPRWLVKLSLTWAWFTGNNDAGVCMLDPTSGAGYDGLEPAGRNANQGAESTLAMLATAQLTQIMRATR